MNRVKHIERQAISGLTQTKALFLRLTRFTALSCLAQEWKHELLIRSILFASFSPWNGIYPLWGKGYPLWGRAYPLWGRVYPSWGKSYPLWGRVYPLWGRVYPLWGKVYPLWGKVYPLWGRAYPLWGKSLALRLGRAFCLIYGNERLTEQ
ncbi:MAG: hypothetical protein LBS04_06315 [Tannerellaceae bacterium]|nr:hypothetical protein [Tannerellaceae bacterium]